MTYVSPIKVQLDETLMADINAQRLRSDLADVELADADVIRLSRLPKRRSAQLSEAAPSNGFDILHSSPRSH